MPDGAGSMDQDNGKLLKKIYTVDVNKDNPNEEISKYCDAKTRDSNGVDTTTCFGIPGSGLPRRHCNVDIKISIAVFSDQSVYISIHDGKFFQNVFGRGYSCRIYSCPHPFMLKIPVGTKGWDGVKFTNGSEDCSSHVTLISQGTVQKTYESTYPFEWIFGPTTNLVEGQRYKEGEITVSCPKETPGNGGKSTSDSGYVPMGVLSDDNWKLGAIQAQAENKKDRVIYLCGGIVYGTSTIDSDITAVAVPIVIEGFNLASYYFPGDEQEDVRMSLNRPGGHLFIYSPTGRGPVTDTDPKGIAATTASECFDSEEDKDGDWIAVKNTIDDAAVEAGDFVNFGFRLERNRWIRLIITGKGGQSDDSASDEEADGIGSDSPGSTGAGGSSGNGICCCCPRRG